MSLFAPRKRRMKLFELAILRCFRDVMVAHSARFVRGANGDFGLLKSAQKIDLPCLET